MTRNGTFPRAPSSALVAGAAAYYAPRPPGYPYRVFALIARTQGVQVQSAWNADGVPDQFSERYEKSSDAITWTLYSFDDHLPASAFASRFAGRQYGNSAGDASQWWRITVWGTWGTHDGPASVLVYQFGT